MTPTAIYSKNPDYVQRDVAGECLLVPIRRTLTEANCIYVLNETGAALWHRIDGQRSAQDIVSDFCNEYEVTADQLAKISRRCSTTSSPSRQSRRWPDDS